MYSLPSFFAYACARHKRTARVGEIHPHLQCINVVGEDDDLVSSLLMEAYQELASLKLARVHAIKQHALARLLFQVLAIELWRHWTPHFSAL